MPVTNEPFPEDAYTMY